MIAFEDAKKEAKKNNIKITESDFTFTIFLLLGYKLSDCALLSGKYKPRENTVTEKNRSKKTVTTHGYAPAKKAMETDEIKWLQIFLQPYFIDDVKEYVIRYMDQLDFIPKNSKQNLIDQSLFNKNKDDIELTFDELAIQGIKKNLLKILSSEVNLLEKGEVDTYLKACGLGLQRLLPPPKEEDKSILDEMIIEVNRKFNAICTKCNHEIDVARGLICICPYCKTKHDLREDVDIKEKGG